MPFNFDAIKAELATKLQQGGLLTSNQMPSTSQTSVGFNQTVDKPGINPVGIVKSAVNYLAPNLPLLAQGKFGEVKNQIAQRLANLDSSLKTPEGIMAFAQNAVFGYAGALEEVTAKTFVSLMARETNPAKIVDSLIQKGFSKDIAETYAPKIAESTDKKVIEDLLNGAKDLQLSTRAPGEAIVPKDIQPLAQDVRPQSNLTRLGVSQEAKNVVTETVNQIKPELQALKGGVLSNAEVVDAAKTSDILRNTVSKESTLQSEAALLKTRQHLAELAKGKTVTADFVDTLKVISSEATKRGRELQALGIEADPELGSVRTKIIRDLLKIGKSTDEIVKAAEGVDFTNAEQVTKFYRQFVKPTLPEIIDEYRYINLLSSPKTHIVNAFSNILQTTILRPATRLASGLVDVVGSKLTGAERQYYVSQVPAYYKGVVNSIGDALVGFNKVLRGESIIARPDVKAIPTGLKIFKPFVVIPRLLEASDVFFRTLATGGEVEALMSKGVTEAQAIRKAADTASELVFRKALDPANKTGQGVVLSAIDNLTKAVYTLKKVPGVKWFVPFVQTPMNILKQGIEYSPLGISTLAGATNKTEQLGKTLVGSTVFAGAGWLALNDRTTWSAPTAQKEKDAFYGAGLQPYSLKIGDKWVTYSRLGPLAYPIAMASAIKFYTEQNPNSVSDSDLQKTTKVLAGIAKFFADQSYVQGLGDFVNTVQGDVSAINKGLSNIPAQLIPLASLQRWVANLIDPIYRKSKPGLSVEGIVQTLEMGIPFLSKNLEAYKDPFGAPSKRQFPYLNSVSPIGVTQQNDFFKGSLDMLQQKKRLDLIKQNLKDKLKQRVAPNL